MYLKYTLKGNIVRWVYKNGILDEHKEYRLINSNGNEYISGTKGHMEDTLN